MVESVLGMRIYEQNRDHPTRDESGLTRVQNKVTLAGFAFKINPRNLNRGKQSEQSSETIYN